MAHNETERNDAESRACGGAEGGVDMNETMTVMRVAPGTGRLAAESVDIADPPVGHVLDCAAAV